MAVFLQCIFILQRSFNKIVPESSEQGIGFRGKFYPSAATCYRPMCMKKDLALSWCLRCHPKISLKSLRHFIFHGPPYRTSSVFPSKFHGYQVSAGDCEFVFACVRLFQVVASKAAEALTPLCAAESSGRRLWRGLQRINTQIWFWTDQARSFRGELVKVSLSYMGSHARSVSTSGHFMNFFIKFVDLYNDKSIHFQLFFHLL